MKRNQIQIWILIVWTVLLGGGYANADYEPVYAKNGLIVAPEPNAAHVGLEVLKRGGNAFDAAAAVGFALAVTYPAAGNIGGGGFLVALTKDGKRVFLDFRETAPAAASRTMYLDEKGEIVKGSSTDTLLAVGTPGTVHGLLQAQGDYGNLTREEILAGAIHLAEDGFSVPYPLTRSLRHNKKRLSKFASTKALFYPDGEALPFGCVFKQPDLAWTLKAIRDKGTAGFYEGSVADRLVSYMEEHRGIITHDDLKGYTSKYREPVVFTYKNYELITPSLPSSGGITLAQILKLVEPFPLKEMGYHSARYVHAVVEAERLAFADRNHYLGDADFVSVPVEELISDRYLKQRGKRIPNTKAGRSHRVGPGRVEAKDTTHYCIVDRDRNVAAVTYTLNGSYGMGAVVEGAGFLLNNEMDDFAAKPGQANMFGLVQGEANAIEPGKRMLSCMTPTIVTKNGQFEFTIGTPGGPTIITTVAQIFLNMTEMGMNVRSAIDAPRFHHQWLPDEIKHEPFAFSPDTRKKLRAMGYTMKKTNQIGSAAGIQSATEGLISGYYDGRGYGVALGY